MAKEKKSTNTSKSAKTKIAVVVLLLLSIFGAWYLRYVAADNKPEAVNNIQRETASAEGDKASETQAPYPLEPVDSKANSRTRMVLNYLNSLKYSTGKQILTGQSVFNDMDSYKDSILDLKSTTGQTVGLTQTWFNYPWMVGTHHTNFSFVLPFLNNYSNAGTVSMVLFNPENPWTGRGINEDKETNFIPKGKSVKNLIEDTESQEYKVYREQLSLIADCLQELEDRNITVILRMFGECNMGHSWYHHTAPNMSGADFKKLWNYTQDYFINTRDLHNLLFCYEEAEGKSNFLKGYDESKVDINGIQWYVTDEPEFHIGTKLYNQYKAVSEKPIIVSQFLLKEGYRGNYDNSLVMEELNKFTPDIVGFLYWPGFHRIVTQDNALVMMNDKTAINQSDTGLALANPPSDMPYPAANSKSAVSAGFSYQFNKDKDFEGWTNERSMRNSSVSGGSLNEFFFGPDPAVLSPDMNMSASAYNKLEIRVNNHTDSKRMVIEWETSEGKTGSREFDVNKSTLDYQTYKIDLSGDSNWTGIIKRVRFRLAPDSYWGSADIDSIKYVEN